MPFWFSCSEDGELYHFRSYAIEGCVIYI
jgi:hypothetical protein